MAKAKTDEKKLGGDYQEQVFGKDKTPFTIRHITPADMNLLEAGLEEVSPLSIYNRFLSTKKRFTDRELEYLTNVDGQDHLALVAIHMKGDHPYLAGVARYITLQDDEHAVDFGLIVADEFQGIGLGRMLTNRLIEAAIERGKEELVGTMFASNNRMFRLIDDVPATVEWHLEGETAVFSVNLLSHVGAKKKGKR